MIFNTSPDAIARYLSDLLQFDRQLLEDKTLQWQAQLLANYSASIYVASDALAGGDAQLDAVLESSLAALALKAEVARLDAQARSFEAENRQLHDEVDMLESELRDLRREKAAKQRSPPRPSKPIKSSSSQHPTAGRSSTPRLASPLGNPP
jgi:chromosome segregation ATPase